MQRSAAFDLPLVDVVRGCGVGDDGDPLTFETVRGHIPARYHAVRGGADRGVVWLPGGDGALAGPDGLFRQLARRLGLAGLESLRLGWRRAHRVEEGVRDALVGVHWLARERGVDRVALVGDGFGAAVAVAAAAVAAEVAGIALLGDADAGADASAPAVPVLRVPAGGASADALAAWLIGLD